MSLRMIVVGLGLAAWLAVGCVSSAESEAQRRAEALAIELREVDTLILEARAEVTTGQYTQARSTIAEAIRRLVVWPKTQRNTHWVRLLTTAADTARDAYHLAAERSARDHLYGWLQTQLPGDHPDLLAAQVELARTLEALGDTEGANALRKSVRGSSHLDPAPVRPVSAPESPK